jgi:large subunit ribosomal protein L6
MSRIGRIPIPIPSGVNVSIDGRVVTIAGPKGSLEVPLPPLSGAALDDGNRLVVTRRDDGRAARSQHGLARSLLAGAVEGVTSGYSKRLEVIGVGYRAAREQDAIVLSVGLSHPARVKIIDGVDVQVDDSTREPKIVVSGPDKQKVGEMAARIRRVAPPEPYNGKGIRFEGEQVRRKAGKTVG